MSAADNSPSLVSLGSRSSPSDVSVDPPTLRVFVDEWTSRSGRGVFSPVVARLEDRKTEVNFTLPSDYAEVRASRTRWEGWLKLLDHPTGEGIIPPLTSERQRDALRGLARILIAFTVANAGAPQAQDWPHFLNHLRTIAVRDGISGERQLELLSEWARAEYQACKAWYAELNGSGPSAPQDPGTDANTAAGDSDAGESDSSVPSLVTVYESE